MSDRQIQKNSSINAKETNDDRWILHETTQTAERKHTKIHTERYIMNKRSEERVVE